MSAIAEGDAWVTVYRFLNDVTVRWRVNKGLVAVGQAEDSSISFQVFPTYEFLAGQALQGFQIDATATLRLDRAPTRREVENMGAYLMSIIQGAPGVTVVSPQITETTVVQTELF